MALMQCSYCHGYFDEGAVTEVIARYADCDVYKAPCCGRTVDNRLLAKADEAECHGVIGCAFDTRDGKIIYDGACSNDATWAGRILAKQSIVRLHVVSCEAVVL